MPQISILITIPSDNCCIALYNGTMVGTTLNMGLPENGTTIIDAQSGVNWRYWAITTGQTTTLQFTWDTPDNVLILMGRSTNGLSTIQVDGGNPVALPTGQCGFSPLAAGEADRMHLKLA